MVVAMESIAADVGVSVLQKGGNAVDAAVAVGFALAVTHPFAGNIGGGGYMLIRMADGRATFIDFRERAPGKSSRDMYLDAQGNLTRDSIEGWRSSGVPGSVRGFELATTKYGRRTWAENMAPAIELATKGYPVSYPLAEGLRESRSLARDPESKRIFQRDGRFFDVGDTLVQPDLGRTLQRIAANGANEFYEGETAKRLAEEMAKHGGLITLDDLKGYKAIERTPLQGAYKGYTVITAPPSSSGGIALLEMLGILEGTGYEKAGAGSASAIHYEAEAMRRAYADRNEYLGDPDFVKNPISGLLDKAYLAKLRATDRSRTRHAERAGQAGTAGGDRKTRDDPFLGCRCGRQRRRRHLHAQRRLRQRHHGSGLGFLLNNEMDDFASKPGAPNMFGLVQGERNAIAPGKRPLSSMTPTILLKDGKLFMTVGAPGGSRISTAVLQVILNVVDFGMNIQDAIDAPRVHHQWMPDRLSIERAISPDTVALLKARGYDVDYSPGVVLAQTAAIVSDGGWLQGGSDGRSAAGKAAGY